MATYKHTHYIGLNQHQVFDQDHPPEAISPFSGIYRCTACGRECVSTQHTPLPPAGHHPHSPSQGPVLWRLIVYADPGAKASTRRSAVLVSSL